MCEAAALMSSAYLLGKILDDRLYGRQIVRRVHHTEAKVRVERLDTHTPIEYTSSAMVSSTDRRTTHSGMAPTSLGFGLLSAVVQWIDGRRQYRGARFGTALERNEFIPVYLPSWGNSWMMSNRIKKPTGAPI